MHCTALAHPCLEGHGALPRASWWQRCLALTRPCLNGHGTLPRAVTSLQSSGGVCADIVLSSMTSQWDKSSSYATGGATGPAQIRGALRSDHWNTACELTSDDTSVWWDDLGDLATEPGSTPGSSACDSTATADVMDRIQQGVASVIDGGRRPLVLGGDHSVTYPSLAGVVAARGLQRVDVLHFDAHPDL